MAWTLLVPAASPSGARKVVPCLTEELVAAEMVHDTHLAHPPTSCTVEHTLSIGFTVKHNC